MKAFEIKGIKCDAKPCDFNDDTVQSENYKDWLNKACPKCGANLLTQADYDTVQKMVALFDKPFFKALAKVEEKIWGLFGKKDVYVLKGEFDGSGKVSVSINKDETKK